MAFDTLGIIAPHPPIMVEEVGGQRSKATEASAESMRLAAGLLARFDPDTIVVMSPHAPAAAGAFLVDTAERLSGSLAQFDAPEVSLDAPGDPELARSIIAEATSNDLVAYDRADSLSLMSGTLDHGVLVPMSYLDREGRWPIVVVSLSSLSAAKHRRFGEAIATAAAKLGRRVAFLASGDCSHRLIRGAPAGYSPRAHLFDEELVKLLSANDFEGLASIDKGLADEAGECGLRSFITLGGFLSGAGAVTEVLSYEGPWGVGYLTAVSTDPGIASELRSTAETGRKGGHAGEPESAPVALARRSVESWVRDHRVIEVPAFEDPVFAGKAGAFVSIHENGDLRGCIGTILPTRPTLAAEIVHNAIEAASHDPRFPPITPEELAALHITVDVLHPPEDVSGLEELDPQKYGVIVSCGFKRGLLLPDLEGVESCEHQISIASAKAGIGPGEKVKLQRFRVDRHE